MQEGLKRALDRINELAPDQPVMAAKLRGLMRAYAERWPEDRFKVLEIEQTKVAPLYNPKTGHKSLTFKMGGKEDLLFEEDSATWLMDHKTTSEDISDPDSPYWRQLVIESQHQHYMLLEHLCGRRVDGAVWDVVRKPSISPRNLTKAEQVEVQTSGHWYGDPAPSVDRETPEMYEARVYEDATVVRPQWYFQRRRIARIDSGLLEYAGEVWEHTQDLLWSRRRNTYPRNSGSCMNYGRPCTYLGVCSGYDEITSEKWRKKDWVHPELVAQEDDGRDLLTNSRIRTFQSCRRKHYYTYELGVERVQQEDVETLWFGNVWHSALECWFEWMKGLTDGEPNNEQASEVCCGTGSEGGLRQLDQDKG